jgi:hypothetical protein
MFVLFLVLISQTVDIGDVDVIAVLLSSFCKGCELAVEEGDEDEVSVTTFATPFFNLSNPFLVATPKNSVVVDGEDDDDNNDGEDDEVD